MKKLASLALVATALAIPALAEERDAPKGVRHLDHVFVIMMENHAYRQIVNNPNAPYINQLAKTANVGTNYFAVAHPSLTNYLEVVGGSNFGVLSDSAPDWHNSSCLPNLATGTFKAAQLMERDGDFMWASFEYGIAHDAPKVLQCWEQALREGDGNVVNSIKSAPEFDFMHGDPQYQEMLHRLNLPQ